MHAGRFVYIYELQIDIFKLFLQYHDTIYIYIVSVENKDYIILKKKKN